MKIKHPHLITIPLLVITAAITPVAPVTAAAAATTASGPVALYLLPDKATFLDPDNLILDVVIAPNGRAVNAVDLEIEFPADKLAAQTIATSSDFCQLVASSTINNEAGELRLACGSPAATATTTRVARIDFKKLSGGWAKLLTTGSQVLAADGLGTNVLASPEIDNIYLAK